MYNFQYVNTIKLFERSSALTKWHSWPKWHSSYYDSHWNGFQEKKFWFHSSLWTVYMPHFLGVQSIIRFLSGQNSWWIFGTKQLILQPEMWLTSLFCSCVKLVTNGFGYGPNLMQSLRKWKSYQSVFHHWTFLWRKKGLLPYLKYENYFHKYIVFIPHLKANYA